MAVGGELQQMQQLKRTFDSNSGISAKLREDITRQIGGTQWTGPAADRFRDAWNSEFVPALKKLEEALREAAGEVQRRHDALERATS